MIETKFKIVELKDGIKEALGIIEQELNLTGCENAIEQIVSKAESEQFATQGARSGDPWKPLKNGLTRSPLVVTGGLRTTMTNPQVAVENNGRVINATFSGDRAFVGPIQQQGFTAKRISKRGKAYEIVVPPRIIFKLINSDIDAIQQVGFNRIVDGLGKKLNRR